MNTRYFTITDPARESAAVEQAADILRRGGLLAIPTETVYGLGADGLNADAVRHIFEAKGRPQDNPLILHIPDASWLARYCKDVPETAYRLAGRFWPGPLTMILPKADCVPLVTTGGLDSRDEPYTEGGCAARELIAMGIDPSRIYAEEKSFDTRENLLFAAAIIRENGLDTHVVIASDNFHQYRGQLFARQAGLTPQSAGCFSPWFLGAGYACREVVGILAVWAGIR